MAVAYMGPWTGEFGWELLTWQAFCRKRAKEFDKSYVSSFPDVAALYEDFATFIPHNHPGRGLDWRDLSRIEFTVPPDADVHIKPHKQYRVPNQEFIEFGLPAIQEFDYILHARNIKKGSNKNYPEKQWQLLVEFLLSKGKVAVVGTQADLCLEGAADLRGFPLKLLMRYIAGSKVVIGQSSGVMHLTTLCKTPAVVWGDAKTYYGETLEKRYKDTWNPFKSPVEFLFDEHWQPSIESIISAVNKCNGGEELNMNKEEEYIEEVTPPDYADEDIIPTEKEAVIRGPIILPPKEARPIIVRPGTETIDALVAGEPDLIIPNTPQRFTEPLPTPEAMEKIMRHIREDSPSKTIPQIPNETEPTKEDIGKFPLPVDTDCERALRSAADSKKWFLTVSYVDPTNKDKYLHHLQHKDFPTNDLTKVLDHIKTEVAEKVVNKKMADTWK